MKVIDRGIVADKITEMLSLQGVLKDFGEGHPFLCQCHVCQAYAHVLLGRRELEKFLENGPEDDRITVY